MASGSGNGNGAGTGNVIRFDGEAEEKNESWKFWATASNEPDVEGSRTNLMWRRSWWR